MNKSVYISSTYQDLRVHPGSYWGLTKLSDHQADGSPAQERKTVAVEAFPVLGQAATSVEPCNGSFDDPAFGQHHELPDIGSPDDLSTLMWRQTGANPSWNFGPW